MIPCLNGPTLWESCDADAVLIKISGELCLVNKNKWVSSIVVEISMRIFNSTEISKAINPNSPNDVCNALQHIMEYVHVRFADRLSFLSRRAVLHNLKYDQQVASFANASGAGAKKSLFLNNTKKGPTGGPCTSISFRTGNYSSRCSVFWF